MPNYEMKFGVSEVARILKVDRDLIKTWAYLFRDYLKPPANPSKGNPRQFCTEDLRVLAYVSMYWEDNPDVESIRCGLNTEDHFEELYNDFIATVTPLFREPPEGLDESWRHGTVIGGWAEFGDTFALADSYKLSGDMLVDAALSADEVYELICPVIYNYRHATELYMKATLVPIKKNHDLLWLLQEFKKLLKSEFDTVLPDWFENIILAFNDFDPNETTFRYGGFSSFSQCGEVWVDIVHMKTLMGWLAESFQNIRRRRGMI
jgi:hypothetical protein